MKNTLKLTILMASLFLTSCTKPDKATEVLEQSGYKNIVITGWRPFMAGESD